MLIEAARRAEAAVKEMLAIANDGSATAEELRDALGISKSIVGISSAFQTAAAAAVAGRERHGDGGAEILAASAGLSRQQARSQVRTAETLRDAPAVRDAVESGRVSQANARRLAEASEKTCAGAVQGDKELLAKAESMRPEQFAKEARRWVVDREGDSGESEHRRLRARRCVRVWDGDDGMVHLHGEFDPVTGKRIVNRLRAEAGRMYDADKKNAAANGAGRRTFRQCMADALDGFTTGNAGDGTGTKKPFADICLVAHVDGDTGKLIAELPDGDRLPPAVLEELACNARLTGLVYDRDGKPIWRTHSVRTATDAQRQILLARYGGCFHCAAHPALCQIHHIKPVSQGGSTRLDNMVPVCWDCHQKIHHHNWHIRKRPDGNHTLHPPGQEHYGPACAPEDPILHLPGIASATLPLTPRLQSSGTGAPEQLAQHPPGTARVPHPPPPRDQTTRAGPAAARAALRSARAERDRTPA